MKKDSKAHFYLSDILHHSPGSHKKPGFYLWEYYYLVVSPTRNRVSDTQGFTDWEICKDIILISSRCFQPNLRQNFSASIFSTNTNRWHFSIPCFLNLLPAGFHKQTTNSLSAIAIAYCYARSIHPLQFHKATASLILKFQSSFLNKLLNLIIYDNLR